VVCHFRDISGKVIARRAIEESREALRESDRRKSEQPWGKEMVLIALSGWGQDDDRRNPGKPASTPTW
jgi:hypothetical protein